MTRTVCATTLAIALAAAAPHAGEVRLKDIVVLQGTTPAPILGYGLVVGLDKTGDKKQTVFSTQTLANMLLRLGVSVAPDQIKVENIAAVLVTGEMPPFARPGARLDVVVSSVGDARSLQGGTLLATPLHAGNGDVVAMAQGPLSIGGFGGGSGESSVQVNHLTVGRVPNGAVVQVGTGAVLPPSDTLTLMLQDPDFVTATRIAQAINATLGATGTRAVDAASVVVSVPREYRERIPDLMARIEEITVQTDTVARVVINERTGTVVVGGNVRIGPAAVAHGNLSVRISTHYDVSQPTPFSKTGDTKVVPETQVDVHEGNAKLVTLEEGTTLEGVTEALNQLGATPRDIIAIVQALKAAGALSAEIVIL